MGLKHNLDIIHIEKNICDSILGILMNINGKSRDTSNARRDLANLGIQKELHLQQDDDRYKHEKRSFCEWLAKM